MGWYNFTAWALNPLKTLLFNPLSAPPFPPAVWAKYHEWFPLEWRVDTPFFGLCGLSTLSLLCVLGVLSYGHKKRIFSFHLSVSLSLSYWCVFPILWCESFPSLVLRRVLFIWPLPTRRTFSCHFYECTTYRAYFIWVVHIRCVSLFRILLRTDSFWISHLIDHHIYFEYAMGYLNQYRNRGFPFMKFLLLWMNHKWFSTNFTMNFIFLLFILFF